MSWRCSGICRTLYGRCGFICSPASTALTDSALAGGLLLLPPRHGRHHCRCMSSSVIEMSSCLTTSPLINERANRQTSGECCIDDRYHMRVVCQGKRPRIGDDQTRAARGRKNATTAKECHDSRRQRHYDFVNLYVLLRKHFPCDSKGRQI